MSKFCSASCCCDCHQTDGPSPSTTPSVSRVPVGTRVLTCWGTATVTHDYWPEDPNYVITYEDGTSGAFTSVEVDRG